MSDDEDRCIAILVGKKTVCGRLAKNGISACGIRNHIQQVQDIMAAKYGEEEHGGEEYEEEYEEEEPKPEPELIHNTRNQKARARKVFAKTIDTDKKVEVEKQAKKAEAEQQAKLLKMREEKIKAVKAKTEKARAENAKQEKAKRSMSRSPYPSADQAALAELAANLKFNKMREGQLASQKKEAEKAKDEEAAKAKAEEAAKAEAEKQAKENRLKKARAESAKVAAEMLDSGGVGKDGDGELSVGERPGLWVFVENIMGFAHHFVDMMNEKDAEIARLTQALEISERSRVEQACVLNAERSASLGPTSFRSAARSSSVGVASFSSVHQGYGSSFSTPQPGYSSNSSLAPESVGGMPARTHKKKPSMPRVEEEEEQNILDFESDGESAVGSVADDVAAGGSEEFDEDDDLYN